jgi:hypothetical protein
MDSIRDILKGEWISTVLPDRWNPMVRRAPWYERLWRENRNLIAGACIAPLVLFAGWKAVQAVRTSNRSESRS